MLARWEIDLFPAVVSLPRFWREFRAAPLTIAMPMIHLPSINLRRPPIISPPSQVESSRVVSSDEWQSTMMIVRSASPRAFEKHLSTAERARPIKGESEILCKARRSFSTYVCIEYPLLVTELHCRADKKCKILARLLHTFQPSVHRNAMLARQAVFLCAVALSNALLRPFEPSQSEPNFRT